MTIEQAIAILEDRAEFNRRSCEGYQSDFSVFCNEEAEAIETVLKELGLTPKPEEGCEFCREEITLDSGGTHVYCVGDHNVLGVDNNTTFETFEINYCPMCGKRLAND